jgi:hypothetical protein
MIAKAHVVRYQFDWSEVDGNPTLIEVAGYLRVSDIACRRQMSGYRTRKVIFIRIIVYYPTSGGKDSLKMRRAIHKLVVCTDYWYLRREGWVLKYGLHI